ncbi:MAG: hypothetical protein K0T00_2584 [Gaiellaceae bacterium]|jgi:hypothetical protein|nr:hypothetical protein [Gaiellaceae bacterium]
MRHYKALAALAATVLTAAVFAVSALAQTPTGSGYGGQAGGSLGGVAGGQAGAQAGGVPASQATGSLPFTGIDLALLVVGGLALTGVGAGLVRAGARK